MSESEDDLDGKPSIARLFAEGFTGGIEGPACDRAGYLYAVDFSRDGTIGRVSPAGAASLWLELPDGSHGCGMVFGPDGQLYVADWTNHNVLSINVETRALRIHAHGPDMTQPNDLAVRPDGTIFASDPNWEQSTGAIWRIGVDGRIELLESGMGTTNGIEVSPDNRRLYVNETVQRTIWVYDLDLEGRISNKRLLIRFPDFGLDGMRCDTAGSLYVTRFGKGAVAVVAPSGEQIREVALEAGRSCTNLCFGGPDGRTAYVTVADDGHIETFQTGTPGRSHTLWR